MSCDNFRDGICNGVYSASGLFDEFKVAVFIRHEGAFFIAIATEGISFTIAMMAIGLVAVVKVAIISTTEALRAVCLVTVVLFAVVVLTIVVEPEATFIVILTIVVRAVVVGAKATIRV